MALNRVTIDEQTWAQATPARQLEWEANIRELLNPSELVFRADADDLAIALNEQRTRLQVTNASGQVVLTAELPHRLLSAQVQEYIDVVRQIENAQNSGRLHRIDALDMAKKVTHDRAGRILKRELGELQMDLATARRLFTLLLSIRLDTSKLMGIYGHRRVR